MSSAIVNIEGSSFDLGALVSVNLNYNFEILKHTLEAMIKAQKNLSIKQIDLEESIKKRDKKIDE